MLHALQRRCDHPADFVTADILDGDHAGKTEIQWCRLCGAYRRGKWSAWNFPYVEPEWVEPHPEWWVKATPKKRRPK